MIKKVVHVIPRDKGRWAVKSKGKQKAVGVFNNKPDAIQKAKTIAKKATVGVIMIHKQNGRLQAELTYKRGGE